jgi:hypothetical protein
MSIAPWIFDEQGKAWPNSLKRFTMSGLLVPEATSIAAKVPASGYSNTIMLEGPQDAASEVVNLIGDHGIYQIGTGTISSAGVNVTGTNTLFLRELQAGDTIVVNGQTRVVAAITTNTVLTTTVAFNPVMAANAFAYYTVLNTDVENRLGVIITDMAYQRELMNTYVPCLHVFGDYQKQAWLKQSLLLERNQTLKLRFRNRSTQAPAGFVFGAQVGKWQAESLNDPEVLRFIREMKRHRLLCQPYWLTLDNEYLTLAANSTGIGFLSVTKDMLLILFNVYGHMTTAGQAGNTTEGFTLKLTEQRTGRVFNRQPLVRTMICGTAQEPFRLPHPMFLDPANVLRADFTNLVTDATTDVWLTLHGVGVYLKKSGLVDEGIMREAKRIWDATQQPTLIPASVQ